MIGVAAIGTHNHTALMHPLEHHKYQTERMHKTVQQTGQPASQAATTKAP